MTILCDRGWVRTFIETTIDRAHLVALQRRRACTSEKVREKAAYAHNSTPPRASIQLPHLQCAGLPWIPKPHEVRRLPLVLFVMIAS